MSANTVYIVFGMMDQYDDVVFCTKDEQKALEVLDNEKLLNTYQSVRVALFAFDKVYTA